MKILVIYDSLISDVVAALQFDMNAAIVRAFKYAQNKNYEVTKMSYDDEYTIIDYKYTRWDKGKEDGVLTICETELEL